MSERHGIAQPKWDVFNKPLPSRLRGLWRRAEGKAVRARVMDVTKEIDSSRHYSTNAQMNSQMLWEHAQDLHRFKSERIPALAREGGLGVPPLTKKLFAVDTCWLRENQFSPMEWY